MIPVLAVPILANPALLIEMLASIDVEVGRTIVIDNGGVVGDLPSVEVFRPGRNLGVAASWNFIMREVPEAPWWAFAGFDIIFAPGDLRRLTDHMEKLGGVALLGGFSAFGIDHAAVERAGWFDENFHPAYFEDNDYDYRCQLAGVPLAGLPAGLSHKVSSTLEANPGYSRQNGRTFPLNAHYYRMKWGGFPRQERFATPFNRGGNVSDWEVTEDRIRELAWEIE